MKLYIVSNSKSGTDNITGLYYLISENGELIDSHFSSNRAWAKTDLYFRNRKNKKICREKYKQVQIVVLGQDEMTNEKLKELNKKFINSEL